MPEQLPLNSYIDVAKNIDQANAEIFDQNERYELLPSIEDEDFRNMAIDGLATEQQNTHDRRVESAHSIDYEAVGIASLHDYVLKTTLDADRSAAEAAIEKIKSQAELSVKIAPLSRAAIEEQVTLKIASHAERIDAVESNLEALNTRELGYHAIGAAWPVPRIAKVELPLPVQEEAVAIEPVAEPAETTAEVEKPSAEQLDDIIQSVIWSITDYAMKHSAAGIRVEEMRREVEELSQLSPEEYAYFKSRFSAIRSLIQERLESVGLAVSWDISGQTRGTRYHLHTQENPETLTRQSTSPNAGAPKATSIRTADSQEPIEMAQAGGTTTATDKHPQTVDITEDISPEQLAEVPFIKDMLSKITEIQEIKGLTALRRTVIARELSNRYQETGIAISVADAGFYISRLTQAGLLYNHGNHRGNKMLSTVPNPEAPQQTSENTTVLQTVPANEIVEVDPVEESLLEASSDDDIEVDGPERSLAIIKSTLNTRRKRINTSIPITIEDIAKNFGLKKNFELAREAAKAIEWIHANPLTSASRQIKAFKNVKINGEIVPYRRFSPGDCPELNTRNIFGRYRIVYAVTAREVVLIDVVDHDTFDTKYN